MKSQKTIARIALMLSIIFFLNSCGARKTDKNRTQEAEKSELSSLEKESVKDENSTLSKETEKENSNVKEEITKAVDDKNETVKETKTWTPVDPNKLSKVKDKNGTIQEFENVVLKEERETTKNNTKTNENSKSEKLENKQSNKEVQADQKKESERQKELQEKAAAKKAAEEIKIDREAWSIWNWLWLLVPIGLIVIIWKNKTKIASWFAGTGWV
jgi:hypothetical protein